MGMAAMKALPLRAGRRSGGLPASQANEVDLRLLGGGGVLGGGGHSPVVPHPRRDPLLRGGGRELDVVIAAGGVGWVGG